MQVRPPVTAKKEKKKYLSNALAKYKNYYLMYKHINFGD